MEPIKQQLFEARAEISRLQTIADSNTANGIKAEERIAALEVSNQRLRKIAERLEVLAVKWVDAGHHDWHEIKELSKALEQKDAN